LEVDRLTDYHVAVFQDRYPVAPGHLLFVPQYNTDAVIDNCFETALREGRRMVRSGECDAFNIGLNMGEAAGQTVMYPHVHLIPRKHGDCAYPVGGVRGVILGQANYKAAGYQLPA
jgi:diadenosine tetraphosphate (Ap4A) HIT family hydrolase